MNNNLQLRDCDRSKKYSLENEKISKNVTLFSNSNLSNEISKLKKNLDFKTKIFNKYNLSQSHNDSLNTLAQTTSNFQNYKYLKRERFNETSLTDVGFRIQANKSDKLLIEKSLNRKNKEMPAESIFVTKNEGNKFDKNFSSIMNLTPNFNKNRYNTTTQLQNFTTYLTSFSENTPKVINLKTELDKKNIDDQQELRNLYRKIFRKKNNYKRLNEIHFEKLNEKEEKLKEIHKKIIKEENPPPKYVNEKIKEIKSKLAFMKDVFDYSYPFIMVKRLKFQNIYFNTYQEKFKQIENLKNEIVKKNSNLNFGDIGYYFKSENTDKEVKPFLNNLDSITSNFKFSSNKKLKIKRFQTVSYNNPENKKFLIPPRNKIKSDNELRNLQSISDNP